MGVAYSPCFPPFSLDLRVISFSFLFVSPLLSVCHIVPQPVVTWYSSYSNKQGGLSVWVLVMSCAHADTFQVRLQGHT